jgi:hypothetical protein
LAIAGSGAFAPAGVIASDGRLPSAARAASALVTAFSTVSGDVPFSRCLRITSWRCFSRRRSSRQVPTAAMRSLATRFAQEPRRRRWPEGELRDHQQREEQRGQHQDQRAGAVELVGEQARRRGAEDAAGRDRLPAHRQRTETDREERPVAANSTIPPASLVQGAVSARTQK